MKKPTKKLVMSRETLRRLASHELADVHGGVTGNTCWRTCVVSLCPCMSMDACTERCPA
jgi:hypothetical protein